MTKQRPIHRTVCPACGHVVTAMSEAALFSGLMAHQEACVSVADDVALVDRIRAAIYEQQLALYRAESLRREYEAAQAEANSLYEAVTALEAQLRVSLHESGPYYFDTHESKMVYRG